MLVSHEPPDFGNPVTIILMLITFVMMFFQVDFDVLRQVITSSGIVFRCGSSVDATKTREVLRWQLKYTFEDLIREMVRADLDAFQSYYKNTNRAIAEL